MLPGRPRIILDVAHNPSAVHILSTSLSGMVDYQKTYGVFAALKDKDIDGVVQTLILKLMFGLLRASIHHVGHLLMK